MLPQDIEAYTSEGLKAGSIPLAFHGHDNLLAKVIALNSSNVEVNLLTAACVVLVEGFGNASTEIITGILKRMGKFSGNKS